MTLTIGMIGAGWVSENHLKAYRMLGELARVTAIADPSAEARERRAVAFGIERTYADAAEMLAAGGLDAVDIVSPRACHAQHVLLAADRGLPVMCQKPLAPTFAEAQALVERLAGRVPLMVHENWRWRPHYRTIREWIDAGLIGRPMQTQMTIFTSGLLPGADGLLPALVRQPMLRELDRFMVMEIMIHHLDCLRFLLGDLELAASRFSRICREIRGEDNATLCLRTASGGSVVLAGSFSAHGYPPQLFDRLEIVGDRGTIRLHDNRLELFGPKARSLPVDLAANYDESYCKAIGHFLDGLDGDGSFETGPVDNLKTLAIVEQVYEAGA
jgi:predicted dehydrogenase